MFHETGLDSKWRKMHLYEVVMLALFHFSSEAVPLPVEAIIVQIQQRGVVGDQHVTEHVLLNGVSLRSPTQEVKNILKTLSAGPLLPATTTFNQISALKNHTIIRSRDCIKEGTLFHFSDHVFCDGKVCLTLEHNNTWTAHIPQAEALKVVLDQQLTGAEGTSLWEGCIQLMKELKLSGEQSVSPFALNPVLVPVLAILTFFGLILLSMFVSNKLGFRHPGGVIGSVIHYPKDVDTVELKSRGYSLL
nr:uncharacterized protein si:dkeyp-13a3.10 [Nothobranchius furzeri]